MGAALLATLQQEEDRGRRRAVSVRCLDPRLGAEGLAVVAALGMGRGRGARSRARRWGWSRRVRSGGRGHGLASRGLRGPPRAARRAGRRRVRVRPAPAPAWRRGGARGRGGGRLPAGGPRVRPPGRPGAPDSGRPGRPSRPRRYSLGPKFGGSRSPRPLPTGPCEWRGTADELVTEGWPSTTEDDHAEDEIEGSRQEAVPHDQVGQAQVPCPSVATSTPSRTRPSATSARPIVEARAYLLKRMMGGPDRWYVSPTAPRATRRRSAVQAGQGLPRRPQQAVAHRSRERRPRLGVQLSRPAPEEAPVPPPLDRAHQRRGPHARDDLQPVHRRPQGRRHRPQSQRASEIAIHDPAGFDALVRKRRRLAPERIDFAFGSRLRPGHHGPVRGGFCRSPAHQISPPPLSPPMTQGTEAPRGRADPHRIRRQHRGPARDRA